MAPSTPPLSGKTARAAKAAVGQLRATDASEGARGDKAPGADFVYGNAGGFGRCRIFAKDSTKA